MRNSHKFISLPPLDEPNHKEIEQLDRNGYVVIKDLLSKDDISEIKREIERIKEREGPRLGEHGHSKIREQFIQKGNKFGLFCFDSLYLVLKFILGLSIRIIPQIRQAISLYTRVPMDYRYTHGFTREFRQMLICIVEQYDDPKDERICDLVNKGEVFDIFYQHQKILGLVKHVIGEDFKLSSLNLRSPKGKRNQDMHVDYPWAVKGDRFYACNALWLLDDIDESNGATRFLPGTQTCGKMPYEEMPDLKEDHPEQVLVKASAGDVIFLNSHVWHGGTANKTGKNRTIVQSYYVHKAHVPQQFHRFQLLPSTKARLSQETLDILDIP